MRSDVPAFDRPGPFSVRHASFELRLPDYPRKHVFDVWSPADPGEPCELVMFCHGFGGHRAQSTFLLKHLASHGYVAVAPDHHGLTLPAIMALAMQAKARGEAVGPALIFGDLPRTRPAELLAMLAPVRSHVTEQLALPLRPGPCALIGHSFGAYTGLVAAARTRDIRCVIALAPAGGLGPVHVPAFATELDLARLSAVPTCFIAAERDSLIPVPGVEGLCRACAGDTDLWLLEDADHVHFCDNVEQAQSFLRATTTMAELRGALKAAPPYSELMDETSAHAAICGVVAAELAHRMRQEVAARKFLDGPPSELPIQRVIHRSAV